MEDIKSEVDILQDIEVQTKTKFTKENSINPYTSMGYTTEDGRVTGIGLFKCGLSNLPESIGNLQSLKELYLGNNILKHLPKSICNLKSLQDLHLEENKLKNLPESIGNLESLQILWLGFTEFKGFPESIGNLKSLQQLFLNPNLVKILPESIQNLEKNGLKINGRF